MQDEARVDRSAWRRRAADRRSRAGLRRLIVALGVGTLVLVGSGAYLLTVPDPAAEFENVAVAFAADWPTMPLDDLRRKWFETDMNSSRQQKLHQIFERRGWLGRRPTIRYVLGEMSSDGRSRRSEYELEGFPPDRRLKVYWTQIGEEWRVTAPSIPVLRDHPTAEPEQPPR